MSSTEKKCRETLRRRPAKPASDLFLLADVLAGKANGKAKREPRRGEDRRPKDARHAKDWRREADERDE